MVTLNIQHSFFSLLLRFIGLNYAMSLFDMYFWNFVSIIIFKFGTQNLKNFANSSWTARAVILYGIVCCGYKEWWSISIHDSFNGSLLYNSPCICMYICLSLYLSHSNATLPISWYRWQPSWWPVECAWLRPAVNWGTISQRVRVG